MMGPSAIGAQPPPEERDEEWLMQEDEEGDEPFCNCTTGHSIEETDWNQCDSCGKLIYDEEVDTGETAVQGDMFLSVNVEVSGVGTASR